MVKSSLVPVSLSLSNTHSFIFLIIYVCVLYMYVNVKEYRLEEGLGFPALGVISRYQLLDVGAA